MTSRFRCRHAVGALMAATLCGNLAFAQAPRPGGAVKGVPRPTAGDDAHLHALYQHTWNGPQGGASLVMDNSVRCTFSPAPGQPPASQAVSTARVVLNFGGLAVKDGACTLSVLNGNYLTNLDVRNAPAQATFSTPSIPCTFTAHAEPDHTVTVSVQGQVSLPVTGAAPILLSFEGRTTDAGTKLPVRFHMQSSPVPTYCPSLQPVANPDQTIHLSDH